MLTYPNTLISKLSDGYLLVDANVLFHAVDNEEFFAFLAQLRDAGCSFFTIQPVVFEFARGARRVEELNWYIDYINNLGIIIYKDAESQVAKDRAFAVLLQTYAKSGKKGISYTDFLLLMLMHKFAHLSDKVRLMTANYTDVPLNIFDRTDILALEYRDTVQTQALYQISQPKIDKLVNIANN